jgi:phage-related holin
MEYLASKSQEFFSNLWLKIIALIPLCFFDIDEHERIVIFALLVIMILDLLLGMMKASFIDKNFDWSLMGKKFSKKFVLFFVFLLASYVLSKAFSLVGFWFYMATGLVCFSEFGSMAKKAQALGLPIRSDIVEQIKNRGESFFLGLLEPRTVETITESFEKHKAEDLKKYNLEKAVAVKAGNIERAEKEARFVEKQAKKQEKFVEDKNSIK